MAGFARHIGAVLVAIALVAAQIMPAWAGCHSHRHAAVAMAAADIVKTSAVGHHGMSHMPDSRIDVSLTALDHAQPSQNDVCLGNCGCACCLGSMVVLGDVTAVNAPHGVALDLEFAAVGMPLGERPEGPRRPPRITA